MSGVEVVKYDSVKKIIFIVLAIFILQFLVRLFLVTKSIGSSLSLVVNLSLSENEISQICNDNNPPIIYRTIERCPNGDIYVGRHAPEVDGQFRIYDKNKNLIESGGGMSPVFTITPVYLLRTLIFQKIGCEEKEAKNYCI